MAEVAKRHGIHRRARQRRPRFQGRRPGSSKQEGDMATTKTRRRPVTSGKSRTAQPPANGQQAGATGGVPAGQHTESEDHPWTIAIPDHVGRTDSPEYIKSRATMNQIAGEMAGVAGGLFFGSAP